MVHGPPIPRGRGRLTRSKFAELVAAVDYPVFVVTVSAGEERAGCLVSFATQCSIKPARFLVCISDKNRTLNVASRADVLAVHVLSPDDRELAELFGGETGDEVDKFAHCRWSSGPSGVPVIDGVAGWFAGSVVDRVVLGDHVGFVLAPIEAGLDEQEEEDGSIDTLTFHETRDITPGHEP